MDWKRHNVGGGEVSMDWEVSKDFLGGQLWEVSTGLGTVHIFGQYFLGKNRKNSPPAVLYWKTTVILPTFIWIRNCPFLGFLAKIFGQFWELSGHFPPCYVILPSKEGPYRTLYGGPIGESQGWFQGVLKGTLKTS